MLGNTPNIPKSPHIPKHFSPDFRNVGNIRTMRKVGNGGWDISGVRSTELAEGNLRNTMWHCACLGVLL